MGAPRDVNRSRSSYGQHPLLRSPQAGAPGWSFWFLDIFSEEVEGEAGPREDRLKRGPPTRKEDDRGNPAPQSVLSHLQISSQRRDYRRVWVPSPFDSRPYRCPTLPPPSRSNVCLCISSIEYIWYTGNTGCLSVSK